MGGGRAKTGIHKKMEERNARDELGLHTRQTLSLYFSLPPIFSSNLSLFLLK